MTDSTCDITNDVLTQMDVYVVPLTVNFGTESYADGIDIDVVD